MNQKSGVGEPGSQRFRWAQPDVRGGRWGAPAVVHREHETRPFGVLYAPSSGGRRERCAGAAGAHIGPGKNLVTRRAPPHEEKPLTQTPIAQRSLADKTERSLTKPKQALARATRHNPDTQNPEDTHTCATTSYSSSPSAALRCSVSFRKCDIAAARDPQIARLLLRQKKPSCQASAPGCR